MSDIITATIFQSVMNKVMDKIDNSKKIIFPKFKDVFIHSGNLTVTKKIFNEKKADLEFKNNLNDDQKIFNISGNVDTNFKTHGFLMIQIGKGNLINLEAGDLKNSNLINIDFMPYGHEFLKDDTVKIWVYNDDANTSISINLGMMTGRLF